MKRNLLVSVIITTYGNPNKLERAINSALNQTYGDIEVIVVDDNNPNTESRKKTEMVMTLYQSNMKVTYIKHDKNRNGAAARNTGIDSANGTYIAFLDNDDIYTSERIEKSVYYLENNKTDAGVLTSVILTEDGVPVSAVTPEEGENLCYRLLEGKTSLGTGSNLFFRKEIVDDIGKFDVRFLRYQDLEYFLRVASKYKIGIISEKLIIKDSEPGKLVGYKKMKEMTILYLQKFEYLIAQMSVEDKNNCYSFHFSNLLEWAIQAGDKKGIDEEYDILCKNDLATEYHHLLYKKRIQKSYRFALVRNLKKIWITKTLLQLIRKFKIRLNSIKSFSNEDINTIRDLLGY